MSAAAPRRIRVWDLPTRLFHWTLAALVVGSFATVKAGSMIWHERLGYAALALVAFRIVWGFVGGRYARFASFVRGPARVLEHLRGTAAPSAGHNPLGALSVLSLLGVGSQRVYAFSLFVLQIGLVAFLIPFYFYYFSVHWPSIVGFLRDLVPSKDQPRVFEIAAEMDRAVAGFVRGRIVICVAMGVMFAIGWQLCGVPYGIALGLLIGAFSIVPYLGGIGVPVAIGLLVADQFSLEEAERMSLWGMLLWPTLVFVVVQSIEGYVLTPIIAGKATNLDPVTIVVAILAGGTLAGVYGMLLAIPIAACGKIAASRLLLPRVRAWAQGRASDPLPINHN
jgi:predicted PurR-regulated permease PerM